MVTCTLKELREAQVNMFTTVFIGNAESEIMEGKLVTKRGYVRRTSKLTLENGDEDEKDSDFCRNH